MSQSHELPGKYLPMQVYKHREQSELLIFLIYSTVLSCQLNQSKYVVYILKFLYVYITANNSLFMILTYINKFDNLLCQPSLF